MRIPYSHPTPFSVDMEKASNSNLKLKRWVSIFLGIIALSAVGFPSAFAQEDPQFSQNMYNRLPINPGYAGSTGGFCATTQLRTQWVGFDGAPKTGVFSADGLVNSLHGGAGLNVLVDRLGAVSTIGVKASYAYRMRLFETGRLALGIDAGIIQKSIKGSELIGTGGTEFGDASGIAPDFGFGVYFNTDDYYFGASVTHLTAPKLTLDMLNGSSAKYEVRRNYYFTGGYNLNISPEFTFKPSIFIKSDFNSAQIDINGTILYNNLVWAGVSYRLQDAAAIMVGLNLTDQLRFGYSYDIPLSDIKAYTSGSHEILLKYCFNISTKRPSLLNRNVRFL